MKKGRGSGILGQSCGYTFSRLWYRVAIDCVLGDLNGWVGDRVSEGVNGAFGVPGENDN